MEPTDPAYDWLISDITRPHDLALLEGLFERRAAPAPTVDDVERAATLLRANRPAGQTAAIAAQLREDGPDVDGVLQVASPRTRVTSTRDRPQVGGGVGRGDGRELPGRELPGGRWNQ